MLGNRLILCHHFLHSDIQLIHKILRNFSDSFDRTEISVSDGKFHLGTKYRLLRIRYVMNRLDQHHNCSSCIALVPDAVSHCDKRKYSVLFHFFHQLADLAVKNHQSDSVLIILLIFLCNLFKRSTLCIFFPFTFNYNCRHDLYSFHQTSVYGCFSLAAKI